MKLLIYHFLLAGLLAFVLPLIGKSLGDSVSNETIWKAVMISLAISLATAVWSGDRFRTKFPAASVLLTTTWRIIATGGVALASAATKWPDHKSFCFYLLGCYFSFFILESASSITRIVYLSRR